MSAVPNNSEAFGFFQGDLIIRSAIIYGLKDLRANPWYLDFAFNSLRQDALTNKSYGGSEIQAAKDWFKKTEISVVFNVNIDQIKFPCISVAMLSSQELESESTLGDTHYLPFEDNDFAEIMLAINQYPSYDATTGIVTFNPNELGIILAPGMVIVGPDGTHHPILTVTDPISVVTITPVTTNLNGCQIIAQRPSYLSQLESGRFKEAYAIGCHVDSEPKNLIYLHTLLVFLLKKYNKTLFETRGFERMVINSTDFRREDTSNPELFYQRYCQITGVVTQVWPQSVDGKIQSINNGQGAGLLFQPIGTDELDPIYSDEADFLSGMGPVIPPTPGPILNPTIYFGTVTDGTYNQAFILALPDTSTAQSWQQGVTVDFSAGSGTKFAFLAVPSSFGLGPPPQDAVTGFMFPFNLVATAVSVNGVNYDLYKSTYPLINSFLLKFKS